MFTTIFKKFFQLGWTSFGGPAAHIGYFRKVFVEQEQWATEQQYAQWVALSQVMPGPGSSQVGFAVGYHRGGVAGGVAAFLGFTLPSVILMCLFAWLGSWLSDSSLFNSIIGALKVMAIVIVLDAILGMGRNFCKDSTTRWIAAGAGVFILIWPFALASVILVIGAGLVGAKLQLKAGTDSPVASRTGMAGPLALVAFLALFIGSFSVTSGGLTGFAAELFQGGSLIFGGGHVVLPVLTESLAEYLPANAMLTGYAAAQAVPGPMFTLATYLGAVAGEGTGLIWALVATLAIFLPGLLLMLVGQHYWHSLARIQAAQSALVAINAAVVGLLAATLIFPIIPAGIHSLWDVVVVVAGFVWLQKAKPPIWQVLLAFVVYGVWF
ncbi:chromate efflux transporter [Maribrevibacterium harenarium]|uniref:Chromate efflux transporter n=1 Tax=Maribrevibacterium harenarium TaxID=2589817 RepID=A0A501X177_9GAMM|nr:chromate efflux transporter [Maribrevibacterium harenarium]TPE54311.1 chromate efflux transporter [Maribrevibacterium harenarium]